MFMVAYVFYFYVRIRYTLTGGFFGYSLAVLIVEFMSSTNMVSFYLLPPQCITTTSSPVMVLRPTDATNDLLRFSLDFDGFLLRIDQRLHKLITERD